VIFPVHPRTRSRLEGMGYSATGKVTLAEPMEYTDFIGLEAEARLVVTDSGGVQEETSVLGTPCLTYRTTTERPVTIELGTNVLTGVDPMALRQAAERVLGAGPPAEPPQIPLWDGKAGPRAAAAIEGYLAQNR
jgi:UDP-N-acetylglucosamine 2-epimerase (non-hydrolysing)